MTDKQPTDRRLPIIRRLALALGIPRDAVSGFGEAGADKPPTIEVDLHLWGGDHHIAWRERGKVRGSLTITPARVVFADGAHCSTWAPPITVDTPTIAEAVIDAAGRLVELIEARDDAADMMADLTDHGWKESVAAAAVRTVTSPDPYAPTTGDEHCHHGYPYPDCAVCHRTAGGAPNRDPGEHDPAAVGVALGLQATIERLKNENAEMKARLGIDPDGYSREAAAERCRHGHTDPDCPICHVGERDPDEPEGVELNLRRRKFPPPAAQPQAVAKFRALYSGGMGPTLEVDSNELAHILNYVQEVEDSVTRSRVRAQDLAAAHHEAERLATELAQVRHELDEQITTGEALQMSIDQCSATHNIDWPGDE